MREKDAEGEGGDVRNLGKPVELAARYYSEGADEITFLNITAFRDSPLEDNPLQARTWIALDLSVLAAAAAAASKAATATVRCRAGDAAAGVRGDLRAAVHRWGDQGRPGR